MAFNDYAGPGDESVFVTCTGNRAEIPLILEDWKSWQTDWRFA
jgi:hypothetical protein